MGENNEAENVVIHALEFNTFIDICTRATVADLSNTYTLPDLGKKFIEKGEADFIQMLANYHENEDEKWRIRKDKVLNIQSNGSEFKFGDKTLLDSEAIYVIPKINSIFVIPGERSIKEGRCSPVEVYQFTNLISTEPMLIRFTNLEREGAKPSLSMNLQIIQRNKDKEKGGD